MKQATIVSALAAISLLVSASAAIAESESKKDPGAPQQMQDESKASGMTKTPRGI